MSWRIVVDRDWVLRRDYALQHLAVVTSHQQHDDRSPVKLWRHTSVYWLRLSSGEMEWKVIILHQKSEMYCFLFPQSTEASIDLSAPQNIDTRQDQTLPYIWIENRMHYF